MKLTPELLAQYNGGQVVLENPVEGHLRGEIREIRIDDEMIGDYLFISTAWLARLWKDPRDRQKTAWQQYHQFNYSYPLKTITAYRCHDPRIIGILPRLSQFTILLYPPDHSTNITQQDIVLPITAL